MPVSTSIPPHDLQLVLDFVNTHDLEAGTDAIAQPTGLAVWLREHGLLEGASAVSADEHRDALTLRDALRQLMLAHNEGAEDPAATAELQRAARRGELAVQFAADGTVGPEARAGGVAGALARVLVPVANAAADGSWMRVKACRCEECQWAFYDTSRNRSGRWCDMAVCGNRTKVRSYRARH